MIAIRAARRQGASVLLWLMGVGIFGHYVWATYENQRHDDCREDFQLAFIAQIVERGKTGTANTEAIDGMARGLNAILAGPLPTNHKESLAERARFGKVFATYLLERSANDELRARQPYPPFPDC